MPLISRSRQFFEAQRAKTVEIFERRTEETVQAIKDEIGDAYPPASAPGTPPHKRTGNLQNGVQGITTEDTGGVQAELGSAREDGDPRVPVWLEFGTAKMAPRPYMSPAKENEGPKFKQDQAEALRALTR